MTDYLVIKDDGYNYTYEEFNSLDKLLEEVSSYYSPRIFRIAERLDYDQELADYNKRKELARNTMLENVKNKLTLEEQKFVGLI